MRVVVALGGNALAPGSGPGTVAEERQRLAGAARSLADLAERGADLVLTHGNGPQVGRILLQQQHAAARVPRMPMDVCGAQSQGEIGYLLAQALDSELRRRGAARSVLCLLTQVVVDPADPALRHPTKPVGPSYGAAEAHRIAAETGQAFRPMPDGRWRRVVPSPAPLRFVEEEPLRALVAAGHVVVAAGGGGVPVVEDGPTLRGVEAVVDKDLSTARLATLVGADLLLLLTDVPCVQAGFGTPHARDLARLTVAQAEELLAAGEFPEGSMGPKVRACVQFVRARGTRAVIAALDQAAGAARGETGTSFAP